MFDFSVKWRDTRGTSPVMSIYFRIAVSGRLLAVSERVTRS